MADAEILPNEEADDADADLAAEETEIAPAVIPAESVRMACHGIAGLLVAGVSRVGVTLIDPVTDTKIEGGYRVFDTIEDFAEVEPDLRERSWRERVSMVVKPLDGPAGFINEDDLSQEQAEAARPYAWWLLETSPASFQARFWVRDVGTDEEGKRVRSAIARALGGEANAGGGGAYRWPGSANAKPTRRLPDGSMPMVRMDENPAHTGYITTVAELAGGRLYVEAPESPRGGMPPLRSEVSAYRRGWPSYEWEIANPPAGRDSSLSAADYRWAWKSLDRGFTVEEVEARLVEVWAACQGRTPELHQADGRERLSEMAVEMMANVGR